MAGSHYQIYISYGDRYQLQFMLGVLPVLAPANNMMPYPIQRQNQPGRWVGFMRGNMYVMFTLIRSMAISQFVIFNLVGNLLF